MSETWTPQILKMRMNPTAAPCARCLGAHATWWKTVPPPSCRERRRDAPTS